MSILNKLNPYRTWIFSLVSVAFLSACDPLSLAVTTGGMTGLTLLEERSVEEIYRDHKIQFHIHQQANDSLSLDSHSLFVSVYASEVLLIGYAQADIQQKIMDIAENTKGVQRMESFLVSESIDQQQYNEDRIIGLNVKWILATERDIHAVNYVTVVFDGRLYIMGLALSTMELERVQAVLRNIVGLRGVISRVQVKTIS